jgi:hypothetical protein
MIVVSRLKDLVKLHAEACLENEQAWDKYHQKYELDLGKLEEDKLEEDKTTPEPRDEGLFPDSLTSEYRRYTILKSFSQISVIYLGHDLDDVSLQVIKSNLEDIHNEFTNTES